MVEKNKKLDPSNQEDWDNAAKDFDSDFDAMFKDIEGDGSAENKKPKNSKRKSSKKDKSHKGFSDVDHSDSKKVGKKGTEKRSARAEPLPRDGEFFGTKYAEKIPEASGEGNEDEGRDVEAENIDEKLKKLSEKLERSREDYLQKEHKTNKAGRSLFKFFRKNIDLGNANEELKNFREGYEKDLQNYISAISETEVKDKGDREIVLYHLKIMEKLNLEDERLRIRCAENPKLEWTKETLGDISKTYLEGYKKISSYASNKVSKFISERTDSKILKIGGGAGGGMAFAVGLSHALKTTGAPYWFIRSFLLATSTASASWENKKKMDEEYGEEKKKKEEAEKADIGEKINIIGKNTNNEFAEAVKSIFESDLKSSLDTFEKREEEIKNKERWKKAITKAVKRNAAFFAGGYIIADAMRGVYDYFSDAEVSSETETVTDLAEKEGSHAISEEKLQRAEDLAKKMGIEDTDKLKVEWRGGVPYKIEGKLVPSDLLTDKENSSIKNALRFDKLMSEDGESRTVDENTRSAESSPESGKMEDFRDKSDKYQSELMGWVFKGDNVEFNKARLDFEENDLTDTEAYKEFEKDYGQESYEKYLKENAGNIEAQKNWDRQVSSRKGEFYDAAYKEKFGESHAPIPEKKAESEESTKVESEKSVEEKGAPEDADKIKAVASGVSSAGSHIGPSVGKGYFNEDSLKSFGPRESASIEVVDSSESIIAPALEEVPSLEGRQILSIEEGGSIEKAIKGFLLANKDRFTEGKMGWNEDKFLNEDDWAGRRAHLIAQEFAEKNEGYDINKVSIDSKIELDVSDPADIKLEKLEDPFRLGENPSGEYQSESEGSFGAEEEKIIEEPSSPENSSIESSGENVSRARSEIIGKNEIPSEREAGPILAGNEEGLEPEENSESVSEISPAEQTRQELRLAKAFEFTPGEYAAINDVTVSKLVTEIPDEKSAGNFKGPSSFRFDLPADGEREFAEFKKQETLANFLRSYMKSDMPGLEPDMTVSEFLRSVDTENLNIRGEALEDSAYEDYLRDVSKGELLEVRKLLVDDDVDAWKEIREKPIEKVPYGKIGAARERVGGLIGISSVEGESVQNWTSRMIRSAYERGKLPDVKNILRNLKAPGEAV
ncbi:MAG: hypothetical protein PHH24_02240 [Candidatus Moranbacteria bacterium]|nr:hypothetical protein [Candidatus Moranbacteria bacterium]